MKTASTRVFSLLAALLLAALSVLSFSACSVVDEIENNSDSNSSATQQTDSESPSADLSESPTAGPTESVSDTQDSGNPENPENPDPFAGVSFGGAEVLLTMPDSARNEFSVKSSGTALSEAVVQRNRAVEKRIQIQLTENIPAGVQNQNSYAAYLQQAVLSGSDIGIAVVPSGLSYLANAGLFRNLAGMPINPENPWFDASFLSAEGIGGYVPFTVGDMNPSAWENSPAVLIRADIASGLLNLPNLYQAVRSRQWTLEFLEELAALLNAGTELEALAVSQPAVSSVLFGINIRMTRQQDGTSHFTLLDEQAVSAFNRLSGLLNADQETPILQESAPAQQNFASGRTVLLIERLGYAQELAKADPTMKLLYLPLPMSDSRQSGYFTTPTSYSMLSVPKSNAQDVLVSTTIEALGYDSTLTLPLSFLQAYLQYGTGTAEATEMLAYLLTGISFAPEILWGALLDQPWLMLRFCLTDGTSLMSSYSSHFAAYGEHLNRLREQFSQYSGA